MNSLAFSPRMVVLHLQEDQATKRWLTQLLHNLAEPSAPGQQSGGPILQPLSFSEQAGNQQHQ